jgi:hypothetical protein
MKQVYVAAHVLDAELVRGLLRSHGIEAVVRGEALFALRGQLPMTTDTLPSVWTDTSAVARARELIDEHLRRGVPGRVQGRSWRCPRCRERLEPQFTNCWRCNASRLGRA